MTNVRERLQFITDNGTILRYWVGVESLPIAHTFRKQDPHPLTEARYVFRVGDRVMTDDGCFGVVMTGSGRTAVMGSSGPPYD